MSGTAAELWEHVHGQRRGYLAIFSGERAGPDAKTLTGERTEYFEWPEHRHQASEHARRLSDHGRETYACAHLLSGKRRVKANAAKMTALYVDGDGAQVPAELPAPTAIVQSSPGREQFWWRLKEPIAPEVGEQLNKRLAYAMDADKSGWDLTQLLRVPGTRNYKYPAAPEVQLRHLDPATAYRAEWLDEMLPPLPAPSPTLMLASPGGPPVRLTGHALQRWRGEEADNTDSGAVDRSDSLFHIALDLACAGATYVPIIAAMRERDVALGWRKYTERSDAEDRYGEIAQKALEYAARQSAVAEPLRRGSARTEPPWPSPLAEEAYYGLAGAFVRLVEPHSESDPAALLLQALTFFGNAIGHGPYFAVEADRHHLNEYTALVGESSRGRKGTAAGHVRRLFEHVDPTWTSTRILAGLSSGEGFAYAVRDPLEKNGTTLDEGVADKRLLVQEAELASVLRVMGRDGSILSPALRDAWDGRPLGTLTKHNPVRATGTHVSVVGHITADELRRHLDSTEAANGFANRFLWVCTRRSKLLPEGGNLAAAALNDVVQGLHAALDFARTVAEMRRDEEARALWHEVYPDLTKDRPGLFGAVTARAEAHVVRLACLYALLDHSATVQATHLLAALAAWEYCEGSARFIFGDRLGDYVADTILGALRTGGPLDRTGISALFGRNQPASRIDRALGLLLQPGLARVARDTDTGGKPREVWTAT
jgi:hypothetical protein